VTIILKKEKMLKKLLLRDGGSISILFKFIISMRWSIFGSNANLDWAQVMNKK